MFDKEEMKAKTEAAMKEWQAQIDKLQAQAKEMQAEGEIKYREQIAELEKNRDEMGNKMNEALGASEEAWKEMQGGFESAWKSISDSFEKARKKM